MGAGTGLAAEEFKFAGYDNITALEPSSGMRKIAAETGYYKELREYYLERG